MFKPIKKLSIIFLSILSLTAILTNNSQAMILNKFKKGFYFEKYKNAEEAKTALLELHPVGSNVEELIRVLGESGAVCNITDGTLNRKTTGNNSFVESLNIKKEIADPNQDYFSCNYKIHGLSTLFFCAIDWVVIIKVQSSDQNKISSVEVYRDFACL